MQFPPEIISTKLSILLRRNIIFVILGNVIDVTLGADEFIERISPSSRFGRWGKTNRKYYFINTFLICPLFFRIILYPFCSFSNLYPLRSYIYEIEFGI